MACPFGRSVVQKAPEPAPVQPDAERQGERRADDEDERRDKGKDEVARGAARRGRALALLARGDGHRFWQRGEGGEGGGAARGVGRARGERGGGARPVAKEGGCAASGTEPKGESGQGQRQVPVRGQRHRGCRTWATDVAGYARGDGGRQRDGRSSCSPSPPPRRGARSHPLRLAEPDPPARGPPAPPSAAALTPSSVVSSLALFCARTPVCSADGAQSVGPCSHSSPAVEPRAPDGHRRPAPALLPARPSRCPLRTSLLSRQLAADDAQTEIDTHIQSHARSAGLGRRRRRLVDVHRAGAARSLAGAGHRRRRPPAGWRHSRLSY